MADIITTRNSARRWIYFLRFLICLIIVGTLVSCFWVFGKENKKAKIKKVDAISSLTAQVSWGFLAATFLLTAAIILLFYCMKTRTPKIEGLSNTFKSELFNLKITLLLFDLTYILRWFSDKYVIPWFFDGRGITGCNVTDNERFPDFDKSICCDFNLIMYYTLTSFVWDWAPIFIILYFHHKSFKIRRSKSIESDTARPMMSSQNDSLSYQSGSKGFCSK